MGILLAFAPFIAFALFDRLIGATEGLLAGALVAAAMLARDLFFVGKTPKALETGTTALFGGLALYTMLSGATWSVFGVRLFVDAGLLAIVLISMALRMPFTLQYAREQVAPALWDNPEFIRANYVITGVWALAFLAMVGADLVLVYLPDLSPRIGIGITILALIGAFKFTSWYPEQRRAKAVG
jgi:hypothetical protein